MSSISAAAAYQAIQGKSPPSGNSNQLSVGLEVNSFNNVANNPLKNATIIQNIKPIARPTSKTAQLVKERRARLEVLEQLKCYLCNGYLIDATTIGECMDSFCRSCILKHLRTSLNCPKCKTLVHETRPLSMLRSDRVLQDIVYKLVPGLYDCEMERRRKYYSSSADIFGYEPDDGIIDSNDEISADTIDGKNEFKSLLTFDELRNKRADERLGRVPRPKPFYSPTDPIDISIEPISYNEDNKINTIESSYEHLKRYLRCPAVFKISQLKKFITIKFGLVSENHLIKVLYLQDILQDDYTLIDMAYIYDWKGKDPIRLFYTITIIEKDGPEYSTVSNKTTHKDDDRNAIPAEKRMKINTTNINGCSQNRVILQLTKPNNYHQSSTTTKSDLAVVSDTRIVSPNFMLPQYLSIQSSVPNTPSTSIAYSIGNSTSNIRPQIYATTAPVSSMSNSRGGNFSSTMLPIMRKCVIQSATSIPIKTNQPMYSQSNVSTHSQQSCNQIENCSSTGHLSNNQYETNSIRQKSSTPKNNNNSCQFQSGSNNKIIYPSSSNQNSKAPVAFSFVTERGITIVRGVNRSTNHTPQTSHIPQTSSSNISKDASKTSLNDNNNSSIVSSKFQPIN